MIVRLQRHSSAFAFGLLESGYQQGDKIVLCADQASAAEQLVAQMGAIKAQVSVVTFHEKDSTDALDHALSSSGAKGLIFTPSGQMSDQSTRGDTINRLIPELAKSYFGDELNSARYPNLKHVVQTEWKAIRGVNLFKDVSFYASPQYAPRQIPTQNADDVALICMRNGKATQFTSGELVEKAQ